MGSRQFVAIPIVGISGVNTNLIPFSGVSRRKAFVR
jgi:hypothetical protein